MKEWIFKGGLDAPRKKPIKKVVFVGEPDVGKTALIKKYIYNTFNVKYHFATKN
jgi:GTPase SAR1 family protein